MNVYDGAKGINFVPQRGTPDEVASVHQSLEAWSKLEFVRGRHEVPPRLEKGVSQLEAIVSEAGADLFVTRPGKAVWEVEMYFFLDYQYCVYRSYWTDEGGLDPKRMREVGSNSPALSEFAASAIVQAFSM